MPLRLSSVAAGRRLVYAVDWLSRQKLCDLEFVLTPREGESELFSQALVSLQYECSCLSGARLHHHTGDRFKINP